MILKLRIVTAFAFSINQKLCSHFDIKIPHPQKIPQKETNANYVLLYHHYRRVKTRILYTHPRIYHTLTLNKILVTFL
jgi:hypothetical protein